MFPRPAELRARLRSRCEVSQMPKLELEFEITGVKLRIKGESEDVVARAVDVQRRLQGAVQALGTIGDGALATTAPPLLPPAAAPAAQVSANDNVTRSKRTQRKLGTSRQKADALELT